MSPELCVLSVSDTICHELTRALADERCAIEHAATGEEAIRRSYCGCTSLLLLDEDPPDMSVIDVLRRIRGSERGHDTLLVVLSPRADEIDRVIAFELGADDYIPKPIGARELSLRLRAVLRRHRMGRATERILRIGPLTIDTKTESVSCDDRPLRLTSIEFRLLEYLAQNPGEVHERRELLGRVWRWCEPTDQRGAASRTVDTHVKRLREKLGPAAEFIETIRGVGYRMRHPC